LIAERLIPCDDSCPRLPLRLSLGGTCLFGVPLGSFGVPLGNLGLPTCFLLASEADNCSNPGSNGEDHCNDYRQPCTLSQPPRRRFARERAAHGLVPVQFAFCRLFGVKPLTLR
jgi:hypothetical protein